MTGKKEKWKENKQLACPFQGKCSAKPFRTNSRLFIQFAIYQSIAVINNGELVDQRRDSAAERPLS